MDVIRYTAGGVRGTGAGRDAFRFRGAAVGLVFTANASYGLLQVTIDGIEYPPVETSGPEAFQQRHCLALGLAPGEHELQLAVWMAHWRGGELRIDGIETADH